MDELIEWQRQFVRALHGDSGAFTHGKISPNIGLLVYQNNRLFSLEGALRAVYPAVANFIGEVCFLALVKSHIAAYPQTQSDVGEYGDHFDKTIQKSGLLDSLPYLAELAQWEWQWDQLTRAPLASAWTSKAIERTLHQCAFEHQITALWQWQHQPDALPPEHWQTPEIVYFFNDPQQRHYLAQPPDQAQTLAHSLTLWCQQHTR